MVMVNIKSTPTTTFQSGDDNAAGHEAAGAALMLCCSLVSPPLTHTKRDAHVISGSWQ